jgi:peptidoglycan/LPS O-acetylase OafA/YrhL
MEDTPTKSFAGRKHSAPTVPVRSFGEVYGFNGLRGIALLIVFVAHLEVILPIPTLLVIPGATVSLDSFFVLSGFLITALLLREQARYGGIGIGPFYRRRALRLLPALYVVVVANALFAYLSHQWLHTEWPSIFSVLFYYSNYYSASSAGALAPKLAPGFQHLWSLSFEEQFYLIWPWLTIALLSIRVRLRTAVIVLLSLIALIFVHRIIAYEESHAWWSLFLRTDTRADSILWGALLAHLWVRGREPRRGLIVGGWLAAAFLVACLPFASEDGSFVFLGGFTAIDIACAVLILAILDGRWAGRHLFEFRPLVALGVVSYAFYLWHLPVFFAIRYFDPHWNDAVRVVVAFVATLSLTVLSWLLIERPLMRWGKRLESRRHAADATAASKRPTGGLSPVPTAAREFGQQTSTGAAATSPGSLDEVTSQATVESAAGSRGCRSGRRNSWN